MGAAATRHHRAGWITRISRLIRMHSPMELAIGRTLQWTTCRPWTVGIRAVAWLHRKSIRTLVSASHSSKCRHLSELIPQLLVWSTVRRLEWTSAMVDQVVSPKTHNFPPWSTTKQSKTSKFCTKCHSCWIVDLTRRLCTSWWGSSRTESTPKPSPSSSRNLREKQQLYAQRRRCISRKLTIIDEQVHP